MAIELFENKQHQFTLCRILEGLLGITLSCSFVSLVIFVTVAAMKVFDYLQGVSHIFALDFSSELLCASGVVILVLMTICAMLFAWLKHITVEEDLRNRSIRR